MTFGAFGVTCSIFSREVSSPMTSKVDIKLEESAHVVGHTHNIGGHFIHRDNHKDAKDIDLITKIKRL